MPRPSTTPRQDDLRWLNARRATVIARSPMVAGDVSKKPNRSVASGGAAANQVWQLDLDLKGRDLCLVTLHFDLHLVGGDVDMARDHLEDFLAEESLDPDRWRRLRRARAAAGSAKAVARLPAPSATDGRNRGSSFRPPTEAAFAHKPIRLPAGMTIRIVSPFEPPRRVAIGLRAGAAARRSDSVTGEPTLEARSTSWLSGMMPSSGIDRISRTSSIFSISPRAAAGRVVAGEQQVLLHLLAALGALGLGIEQADDAVAVAHRGDLRIGHDDGGVGVAHGQRGAALDAGGLSQMTQSNVVAQLAR